MKKIVLVNGPPRSGKDTAGNILAHYYGAHVTKFAKRLKEAAHALYDMPDLQHDAFEARKDEPCPEFRGKTPRQVYIALSETYFKPLYGERIFGEMLLQDLVNEEEQLDFEGPVVVTDSGFVPEAEVLIEHFGADACLLLRMYRPSHDFSGDSRGYVGLAKVKTIDVHNDWDLAYLSEVLCEAMTPLFNQGEK